MKTSESSSSQMKHTSHCFSSLVGTKRVQMVDGGLGPCGQRGPGPEPRGTALPLHRHRYKQKEEEEAERRLTLVMIPGTALPPRSGIPPPPLERFWPGVEGGSRSGSGPGTEACFPSRHVEARCCGRRCFG